MPVLENSGLLLVSDWGRLELLKLRKRKEMNNETDDRRLEFLYVFGAVGSGAERP
jgi:hypothetical protein